MEYVIFVLICEIRQPAAQIFLSIAACQRARCEGFSATGQFWGLN
jgi:hypothetical protein